MIQFLALKLSLYFVLDAQTSLLALMALLHYSGDCSRSQGVGYKFWSEARDRSLNSLEWVRDCGNVDDLI